MAPVLLAPLFGVPSGMYHLHHCLVGWTAEGLWLVFFHVMQLWLAPPLRAPRPPSFLQARPSRPKPRASPFTLADAPGQQHPLRCCCTAGLPCHPPQPCPWSLPVPPRLQMHHGGNNRAPIDASSTEPYQRDSPAAFLHYWLRFALGAWLEVQSCICLCCF